MKYLRTDSNGTIKYRRRVPTKLQSYLGKKEFVKVLGRSETEAMRNYANFDAKVEKLITAARNRDLHADTLEAKRALETLFVEYNLDQFSPGKSEDERLAREEAADRIFAAYPLDQSTGYPAAMAPSDEMKVEALLTGLNNVKATPTVVNAFELYLSEKTIDDQFKRRKQLERFERAKSRLLGIMDGDKPIADVTRFHARQYRDQLLATMSPSSAKRNVNDIKAVFNFALLEYDLNERNPFENLSYPKDTKADIDRRSPLPEELIETMYLELENNPILLDIWTLMHCTGAQNAEILGLQSDDLFLDCAVPHIAIRPNANRGVKEVSRIRDVPVVGAALHVVQRLAAKLPARSPLFPKYAKTNSHGTFSKTMMKRLRKHTSDNTHSVYSLRHNMKDDLRTSLAGHRLELAILGHTLGKGAEANYGSGVSLEEKLYALKSVRA